jgi:hypothetical protein
LSVNKTHDTLIESWVLHTKDFFGYLLHTKNFFIRYKLPDQKYKLKLYAAADLDLAGDPVTEASQTCWFVFYKDGTIARKCCEQDVVSLSTAEAELKSFVACTKTVTLKESQHKWESKKRQNGSLKIMEHVYKSLKIN